MLICATNAFLPHESSSDVNTRETIIKIISAAIHTSLMPTSGVVCILLNKIIIKTVREKEATDESIHINFQIKSYSVPAFKTEIPRYFTKTNSKGNAFITNELEEDCHNKLQYQDEEVEQ